MNSNTGKSAAALSSNKVLRQLAMPQNQREIVDVADLKSNENHTSTTIIEKIANLRRGYLTWLAQQTASITGKEPEIDSEADASWRAR